MSIADIAPALLENWLRQRYFEASVDISSSGVENYTLGELRELLGLKVADLDVIAFRDSPSLGCAPLREAIAARVGYQSADTVMVTHGSTEALLLALAALVRSGDEIVTLYPAYQALSSVAEALGAQLVPWRLDPADDFRPDINKLRSVLTERTRAVVVNFPHNPTGATLSAEQYREFISLLDGYRCHLLWDGASAELTYGEAPLRDPSGLRDRVISTGTLSKAYGLPGLRVGWCSASSDLLAEMVRIRDYVSISTSPLTEAIATAVMTNPDPILGSRLRQATTNRELLRDWAVDAPRISLPTPMGGVSAFPAVSGVADTTQLCQRLQDRGVLVVPGKCFEHPQRLRVGFGGPTVELAAGLSELSALLHEPVSTHPVWERS